MTDHHNGVKARLVQFGLNVATVVTAAAIVGAATLAVNNAIQFAVHQAVADERFSEIHKRLGELRAGQERLDAKMDQLIRAETNPVAPRQSKPPLDPWGRDHGQN